MSLEIKKPAKIANKKEETVSIASTIGVEPTPWINITRGVNKNIEIMPPFIESIYFIIIMVNDNKIWFGFQLTSYIRTYCYFIKN